MPALEYVAITIVVATLVCLALGSACCALAGVMHLLERTAVALAPLRAPRA